MGVNSNTHFLILPPATIEFILSFSPNFFSMAATATTTTAYRQPPKPLDLEITIVSAKHLKNINWRNGDLSPYAIFWLNPDRRLATKSDDSNSTKPVWNERFVIPLPSTASAAVLTLEIFHAKPSDTPKPLVGTLRVPLGDLPDPEDSNRIRTFELRRPSGRPNGKIRLKLALRERPLPDYQNTPQPPYYYATAPPPSYGRYPSSPSPYGSYSSLPTPPPAPVVAPLSASPQAPPPYHYVSYSDPYSLYYEGGCYSQPPPPPSPRPAIDRQFSYVGASDGPSAPVEYAQYDQRRTGKMGSGSGLAVGAITGGLGGLAINEGLRYEDGKIAERVESDMGVKQRDDYSDYRRVDY